MKSARPWLYVSGGFFALSAVLALVTSIPLRYMTPRADALLDILRDRWSDEESTAARRVAATKVGMIASYKRRNRIKAWLLIGAMGAQVLAVVTLAVAIVLVVRAA